MEEDVRYVSFWVIYHFIYIIVIYSANYNSLIVHLAAEEKEPYEAKARQDKIRYKDEISGYKNTSQPMSVDSGNDSDSA